MLAQIAEAGCPIVGGDVSQADVMVVNTCGFLSASREEALGVLREAAAQKRRGAIKRLVVAGCLVQRDGLALLEAIPEIDALVGVHNRGDVVNAVLEGFPADKRTKRNAPRAATRPSLHLGDYHPSSWTGEGRSDQTRLRLTPSHYAYLRMSEGCDQKCTFCTIPSIRGPMHSKTPEEILAEARELIDDGAVELLLIGQDTTSYGRDLGYAPGLAGLLRQLNQLGGAEWIRLMYAYPTGFADEIIDAMADSARVVKYIDLPLQHINDRILKAMSRRTTRQETETLLAKFRRRMPNVALRTTFISGFPGETEAEHAELREFIRQFGFDAVGVFGYSNEPGTPAYRIKEQRDTALIKARVEELMLVQQEIAYQKAAARKGETFRVLIDGEANGGIYPARHAGQAPEVDSIVQVRGGRLTPGQFVNVRCTGSHGYDLLAKPEKLSLPVIGER